jgi:ribosome biogenesis GTPase
VQQLELWGWGPFFESQVEEEEKQQLVPARVSEEGRGAYRLWAEAGEWLAELAGRLRFEAVERADWPAVGDWVLARPPQGDGRALIQRVLERRSRFSRKVAGSRVDEQVIAANIDTVFLVTSLNREFNLRRIERYLTLVWESGARPVVVLNKADLIDNPAEWQLQAESVAMGVPVYVTSALRVQGLDELRKEIRPGSTTALLGSSGVGKSTLLNAFLGEDRLRAAAIREDDDRGRHTTTSRQLLFVPGGGLLMDTPGMRELQLWDSAEGLEHAFGDIEALALQCRFRDCKHESEPHCAVRQAIDEGRLDVARLENYHKLQREQQFLDRKRDAGLQAAERRKWKPIHKAMRNFKKGE